MNQADDDLWRAPTGPSQDIQIRSLTQQRDTSKAALTTYGQHTPECKMWPKVLYDLGIVNAAHFGKCTCGFDAALALAEGPQE